MQVPALVQNLMPKVWMQDPPLGVEFFPKVWMRISPLGSCELHGRTRARMQAPALVHNLLHFAMSD
eukprot:7291555-Karenia_brevis.AAC.1